MPQHLRFTFCTAMLHCIFHVERFHKDSAWVICCNHPEILKSAGELRGDEAHIEGYCKALWDDFREDFARKLDAINRL